MNTPEVPNFSVKNKILFEGLSRTVIVSDLSMPPPAARPALREIARRQHPDLSGPQLATAIKILYNQDFSHYRRVAFKNEDVSVTVFKDIDGTGRREKVDPFDIIPDNFSDETVGLHVYSHNALVDMRSMYGTIENYARATIDSRVVSTEIFYVFDRTAKGALVVRHTGLVEPRDTSLEELRMLGIAPDNLRPVNFDHSMPQYTLPLIESDYRQIGDILYQFSINKFKPL